MITIKASKTMNKDYEIEYTIFKGKKAVTSNLLISDSAKYYETLNKLIDAQLVELKKHL